MIDSIYESYDTYTLGQLLRETREVHSFDEETKENIVNALKRRNHLAHNFFWYNAENFMTDDGRELMINELIKDIEHFEKSDSRITEIYLSISTQYGLTEQKLAQLLDAELNRIRKAENS